MEDLDDGVLPEKDSDFERKEDANVKMNGVGNNTVLVDSEGNGNGKSADDQPEAGTQAKKANKKKQESVTTQWLGDKVSPRLDA